MRFLRVAALLFAAVLVGLGQPALGQSTVLQGGPVTGGHLPMYANSPQPVIIDSGQAGGGAVGSNPSELGITARGSGTPPYAGQGTGPNGENICDYDAPTTNATGYHALCLSANAQGGGLISYDAFGTASALPLLFKINGALSGIILGPTTTVPGDFACWNSTTGSLLSDCGATIGIGSGGTGQTTATAALTALLPSQTGNSGKVLSTNGAAASWQPSGGTGTVTSITAGSGLSGGTITTTGTISLTNNATTVNSVSCALGSSCTVPVPLVVGTTTVTSGTSGRIEYNNAGVLGELPTNGTGNVSLTTSPVLVTPTIGAATASSIAFTGSGSGTATITPQATAGTPTLTLPSASGTFADSATSPLVLSATTGALTCPTCATSSGGGAVTGTAPVAVSAAGVVSITGAAGQVLAGASPAFTATPTLGVAGSTVGSVAMANATSGTITLQPVTGALGSSVLTLPAATDTVADLAGTQTLTNKTISGGSNTITNVSLATGVTGNLPVTNLNGGTSASSTTFWRGDGTWSTPAGSGTVTSIATTAPLAGGTITTTGTLSITGAAGQVLAGASPAFTNAPALGVAGASVGSIAFANVTSGSITIKPVTGALGSATLSLPAATDTLIAKATTDTLTNKTFDTAGTGNSFAINGTAITAVNGSGAVCLTTSCAMVTPSLGAATATSINFGGSSLSAYVTGTWTPTLTFGGGSTGLTYSVHTGTYVRIGGVVLFTARITLTAKGSSTGAAVIGGLPITVGTLNSSMGAPYYGSMSGLTGTVGGLISASSTAISLTQTTATSASAISDTVFTNNTDLIFNGEYFL